MLVTVADMLRYSVAPLKLRAALFEVASHIPGVTLIPGTVVLDGRSGIAVALDHDGTARRWSCSTPPPPT